MTIVGNLSLSLSVLLTFLLFRLTFIEKAPGGDAVVGYAWSIIFCFLGLLVCLIAAAAVIGWQGGFAWIGSSGTTRFFLVTATVIVSVISAAVLSMFGDEPSITSGFLRTFSRLASVAVPLLLIAGAVLLLNSGSFPTMPTTFYRAPIIAGAAAGWAAGLLVLILWGAQAQQNAVARMEEESAFQDRNHLRMLQEIDSCDVSKDMVFILVFTDANQHKDVRERSLAKIKSRPDWQEELIRRLNNRWAEQAFNFLASNDVDDKNLFPEAVRNGILNQAEIFCVPSSGLRTWE
jgi:hypothetical protein